jgi:hypothetical protein
MQGPGGAGLQVGTLTRRRRRISPDRGETTTATTKHSASTNTIDAPEAMFR